MLQEKKKVEKPEYEADKLKLLNENIDEVNNLNIQIEELENKIEKHKQWHILEFIRVQSIQSSTEKTEPLNKILERLFQDKQFTLFLEKVCKKNDFQHIGVSKSFQTYNPCIKIIDAQSWTPYEVLLLGTIYHHYKIPFICHDNEN